VTVEPVVIVTPDSVTRSRPRPAAFVVSEPTSVPLTDTVYVVSAVAPETVTCSLFFSALADAVPVTPVVVPDRVAANRVRANVPVRLRTVIVSPAAAVTPVNFAVPLPEASVVTAPTVVVVPLSVTVTDSVVPAAAPLTETNSDPLDSLNVAVPVAPAALVRL